MIKNIVAFGCFGLFASSVFGHEGHGVPGQGNTVAHYAFAPMHLPMLLGLCVLAIAIVMAARKIRIKRYGLAKR